MFNQPFRKCSILPLLGIAINSYVQAEQPNLGDLNLTTESQVIYYPTESGTSQFYWSDLSDTIQDLNLTGDPSSWNEDTKYSIKKAFLKKQVSSAFEKLDPNHYAWSQDITAKRNNIIKAIYSEEWWDMSQEADANGQRKAWQDFLVDTEKHDILHNSVFATSVFDITSDQNYSVKAYTTGWFFNPEIGWLFSTKDTFPYIYDPTTGQWMQFLQMEGRYGFLHAQTMLLIDVNSSSISPISPFWDSDYYDSNLTLQNLNNAETNPLGAEIIGVSYSSFIGIEDGDFSPQSNLFEWVDIFSGKLPNLTQRINFNFVPVQQIGFISDAVELSTYTSTHAEEDGPSDEELDAADDERQQGSNGIGDYENGSEGTALEESGLLSLEEETDATNVDSYVEVDSPNLDHRRSGHTEIVTVSFEQLKIDAIDFVETFAVNDAFQNPNDYNWGGVFNISDDMETYILSIKDEILQAESDDYQASNYNGFTANLLKGIKVGHFKANITDDVYYNFHKAVIVANGYPVPNDARLNLVTQNENNESRYEFYFHKDNLEVFKSLPELTCDKPYTSGWYYTPEDGWMWTNSEVFPFIYRSSDSSWLYFYGRDEGSLFYDYKNKSFVPLSE